MNPILLEIGPIPLRSYGLMAALGFVAIMMVSIFMAKEKGIKKNDMLDILFLLVVSAILGARTLYVLTNLQEFASKPLDIFKIWNGGIVFYGGLIGVIVTLFFYFRKFKIPALKVFDILATALPLGHAMGRFGCYMAGCCYGKPLLDGAGLIIHKPENAPWFGIKFPSDVGSFAPTEAFMHATQLYAVMYNVFIFLFLFFIGRKIQKKDGDLFFWYLVIYPIFRSINEIFRGDVERRFVIEDILSLSQGISIPIIIFSLYMIFYHKKKTSPSS